MKKERILLSFIATLIGILVTAIAFYFYQSTKTTPASKGKTITIATPTPTPKPSIFLNILKPDDESVVSKKVITVSGNTAADATVIILTPIDEVLAIPTSNGDFSTTVDIDDDQNIIEITAIRPNGEEAKVQKNVTYSLEEF
ncbi:MAG: hypothetical protein HYT08_04435 [Candidatus Levybacteria bacterium]|nr:hypothetical protein [Candidatus Levybacteria bacterium]